MAGQEIVLRKNSNNFSIRIGKTYLPIESSLIPFLCDELIIEKGVTFEDFFNIILKHHEEYSTVFCSHLSNTKLSEFISEWEMPYDNDDDKYGQMEKLIITWENIIVLNSSELSDVNKGLEISWLPSFYGKGKDNNGEEIGFDIEFTPLNKLKKYPLELIPNTTVTDFMSQKTLLFIERGFTVYEVLSAIFYEITFLGNPAQRNKNLNELLNQVKDIEKDFDTNGNFIGDKNKYKSLDEVMKELKEKINSMDDAEESGSQDEFDEYGHKKPKKSLDEILRDLKIDKPKQNEED